MTAASAGTTRLSARRLVTRGLGRNRRAVLVSFVLLVVWQLSEAFVPVVVGLVIDRGVATGDAAELARTSGLLALVFVSLIVTYRLGVSASFRVEQQESHRLRVEMSQHVLRPTGVRSGLLPGEVLSLATSDADAVGGLGRFAGYAFASVAAVVVAALALFWINPTIAVMVLVGIPAVLVLTQVMAPALSRRSGIRQAMVASASGAAADLIRGLRVVKGLGVEREAVARYRAQSAEAADAGIRSAWSRGAVEGLSTGLSGAFLAGVALVAGSRALKGDITIGEFVAVVGLTQFLGVPVSTLGWLGGQAAAGYASARRISDFLNSPALVSGGAVDRMSRTPRLTVATGPGHPALASEPGELLCLVTDDDAATAKLIGLLTRDTSGDEVRLDGTPIGDLTVSARRQNLLVNPHHVDLLDGTLRDNIDPTRRHDDAGLAAILEASAVHDIIRLHEEGLDLPVTSNGAILSGGQRQRIALARALATQAPILVADQPTTAVDAVTEQRIARGIRALRHKAGMRLTTWIVTSGPALLAEADRVMLVVEGRVVAEGRHHDLLADPRYRERVAR